MKSRLLIALFLICVPAIKTGAQIITTIAGSSILPGPGGFSGDGGPATLAQISHPTGVTFDYNGNIYFAEKGDARIRKIDSNGIIITISGTGSFVSCAKA